MTIDTTPATVPNGTTLSVFDELVERYRAFAKKSAENIIKLAETLLEAKQKLDASQMTQFCAAVGLEGSTYRKMIKIGEEASRFEPFIDRIPSNWTTLYDLAKLPPEKFEQVAKDSRFGQMMTADDIELIIAGDEQSKNIRSKPDFTVSFGKIGDDTKLEASRRFAELAEQYGFTYDLSRKIQRLQNQNPPNFAHLTDTHLTDGSCEVEPAEPAGLAPADLLHSSPVPLYDGESRLSIG